MTVASPPRGKHIPSWTLKPTARRLPCQPAAIGRAASGREGVTVRDKPIGQGGVLVAWTCGAAARSTYSSRGHGKSRITVVREKRRTTRATREVGEAERLVDNERCTAVLHGSAGASQWAPCRRRILPSFFSFQLARRAWRFFFGWWVLWPRSCGCTTPMCSATSHVVDGGYTGSADQKFSSS